MDSCATVDSLSQAHDLINSSKMRKLSEDEISELKKQGNHCNGGSLHSRVASDNSWSNVLVMTTEEEAKTNLSSFINCLFIGENVISSQEGEVHFGDDICLPSCVSTTTFKNCVLFPNCFFSNNTLVENCIFLSGSVCMSNGRITCKGRFCFPF